MTAQTISCSLCYAKNLNRQFISFVIFVLALNVMPLTSDAQFSIAATSTNYTQNFDALTTGAWSDNSTLMGWYARTDATATIASYAAGTGASTTAGLYAFGIAGTNPLSDRGLGYVASNAFTGSSGSGKGYYGWRLVNNTGVALTSITVTWSGEEWRENNNASSQSLVLSYQQDVTVNSLTTGTWTTTTSTFTTPVFGTVTAQLDGNLPANRVAGISITIPVSIPAGQEIMLRWEDLNDSGNDHSMAIDDVTISASGCASPMLAINSATNTCSGFSNGAVDVNVSGGTPPFTYLWSNGASTEDISNVAAGTYTVTVTSTGGCTSSISAVVNANPIPTVSFSGLPASVCFNESGVLLSGNHAPSGTFTGTGITDNANGTAVFNPAGAGVGGPYNITYSFTDISTGCSNFQTQQVTVNAAPDIQTIAPVTNTCPSVSVDLGTLPVTNNGATGTVSYFALLSDANNNTNAISSIVSSTGTYFIRITTAQGCYDVEPVSVTINSCGCANPPTAYAGGNFSICADLNAQLNGSFGGGANTALWSGGAGTFIPDANTMNATYIPTSGEIANGSVTLILTTDDPDGAGPCVPAQSNVIITIHQLPAVSVTPLSTAICYGSTSGSITASGADSYSWTPSNGTLSATTGSVVTANPLSTTTYTVTGNDANGCINNTTITVSVNSLPSVSVAPDAVTICSGSTSGVITASGASTYTWVNSTGLSATTGASVTANPVSSTTYTVTGTDGNGCTATATLSVTVNPPPVFTITGNTTVCSGSSVTFDAGPGFSAYLWSTGATTQTASVSASATYIVTVTDANGCTNSASKTLSVSNPAVLSATSTPSTCNTTVPGSIDLTATGGAPCNANSKGLLISKISANPTGNDSPFEFVELIATKDINFAITPYTVIFNNNGTATTNGWVAGLAVTYAFQINTGNAVAGGVYYVGGDQMPAVGNILRAINTITTGGDGGIGNAASGGVMGNGGTSADGVAVFNLPVAAVTSSSVPVDVVFFGNTAMGTAVVGGGTQGYQMPVNDYYTGGKLQSTSFFIAGDIFAVSDRLIVATGTYDVLSNSFTIPRTFTNSSLLSFTEGTSSVALMNLQPYFFNWSNGATTEDISGLTAGDYTVTVTDCNGCSSTISKTVVNVAPPVVSFSGLPANICANATAFNITGSNAPSGTFSGAGITDNGNGTAIFNPATAGAGGPYAITYSYTDPLTGCAGFQTQNITVHGLPDIQPIGIVTNNCPTPTVDLSTITIVNNGVAGTAGYFATLTDANNNTNSISSIVNTSGPYYIRVTTVNGCFDVEPVTVIISGCGCANPPTASAGSNFSICANGTAQLNGSIGGGATSLTWSGGAGTFTPDANTANAIYAPTLSEINSGTVTLTISTDDPDGAGPCVAASGTVTITINALPDVSANPASLTVCSGSSSGIITANGALTYSWAPSTGLSATAGAIVTANPVTATTYTVTGTDANGCTNTATVNITVNLLPSINVTPSNPAICAASSTILTANGALAYTWANAPGLSATTGTAVAANPSATTVYTVTGTDANGCSSTATAEVIVNPLPVVNITGPAVLCNGSPAILNAGSGFTSYLWNNGATTSTLAAASAGTYTVTATDVNGCSGSGSKTIGTASPPVISSIIPAVTCLGNTGSVNITVTGGMPCGANSPGLLISKVLANPGGTDSPFEFVELVATRNIDFSVTPFSVIFSNNGTANASGWMAGGGLTYGFEISSGTATSGGVYYLGGSSLTPLSNHLRTINTSIATGDGGLGSPNSSGILGNGGANADGIAVFNGSILSINGGSAPVDAYFFGTGIGSAAVAGGTQGYQLPINDLYSGGKLQTSSFFGPDPVSGELTNATGTFNVLAGTFTTPRTFANSGTFTEGVSGVTVIAASPYSYNWSNGATTQNLVNVGAGTYTVTVTDCNGCTSSASATVNAQTDLKPYLLEGDSVLCNNDQGFDMHVLDSGAYSGGYPPGTIFDFYGAGALLYQTGTSNTYFNANYSDDFYVIVTLPAYLGGCAAQTDTSTLNFYATQAPQLIVSDQGVSCNSGSDGKATAEIIFGGTPEFRWLWYNSSNLIVRDVTNNLLTDTLTGMPAGMYTLILTDHQDSLSAPYCQVIDSIYISEPSEIVMNCTSTNVSCYGGNDGEVNVSVTGGLPGYSLIWSNGVTTASQGTLVAGTYTVTVTDANGCTLSCASTLLQPALVLPSITGNTLICAGNSSILDAGSGYTIYNWSTGGTTQNISVNTAGSYTVTVTNSNGCTGSSSTTIIVSNSVPPKPGTISGPVAVCSNSNATYSIAAVPGATGYTWTASSGATVISGQGTPTAIISFSNSATSAAISVVANNICGSGLSQTLNYTVSSLIPAQPVTINGTFYSLCNKTNVAYNCPTVINATSYLWTVPTGATILSGQGTNSILVKYLPAFTNTGSITVIAQSGCGNSSGQTRTVNARPQQPVISGANFACKYQTGVSYSVAPVTGATSYTWTIVPGSTLVSGQGTTSIIVNWGGINGVIKCKANNACGSSLEGSKPVSFTCRLENSDFDISEISLYPNPANVSATIDFEGFADGIGELSVIDLIGQELFHNNIKFVTGHNQYQLDLSSLPMGVYTVKVIYNGLNRNCKLIVQ